MDSGGKQLIMKVPIENFEFKQCTSEDLNRILEIQDQAFMHLGSPNLLRKNTPEMFLECLQAPNVTLGAWYENKLIAFSVLYFPNDDRESLVTELEGINIDGLASANYKLCIVDRDFRGNSLQYELCMRLLQHASKGNIDIVCATASPDNMYSIANVEKLGFLYNRTLSKYGYERNLYYKFL